ncbi:hypothetical protein [Burkholderia pseudomallei]|uniref:hypothetical protein n=1 Tax=Burkholderia pseudomallei TaxID=28450 RepID=UPI0018A7BCDE|nr:hypothetical protein [Burkholderia pseudomallei]
MGRFLPIDVNRPLVIPIGELIIEDRSRDAFASVRALLPAVILNALSIARCGYLPFGPVSTYTLGNGSLACSTKPGSPAIRIVWCAPTKALRW